jgi:hypothetical protein
MLVVRRDSGPSADGVGASEAEEVEAALPRSERRLDPVELRRDEGDRLVRR